ncbi:50S ribosomal protein L9 [Rhodomicrobium sp. Az07]|uniref:50S ribosomal protein L9 n=1 Tax=Rhodomicrobium sp. Az07 TaxID=2839034 RepID=UPI001BE8D44C|nr:50S ribosomal protein L9 [Rhodomicrobium sp. Az07]MBT3069943.1 50S ribosomal protein L9 [Rhodomicrobium sp. Az07]
MQVVLLQRVGRLGQMGDVVKVRPGFARNFLLPQGKALRATKENLVRFEKERAQLEAHNLERKQEAEAVSKKLDGQRVIVIRQAGDSGQLYGSVSTRDIADAVTASGFTVERGQVLLDHPIKTLGIHEVRVGLHPEVSVRVSVNVARTEEEALRQAKGEDVLQERDEYAADYAAEQAAIAAETLFEGEEAVEQ